MVVLIVTIRRPDYLQQLSSYWNKQKFFFSIQLKYGTMSISLSRYAACRNWPNTLLCNMDRARSTALETLLVELKLFPDIPCVTESVTFPFELELLLAKTCQTSREHSPSESARFRRLCSILLAKMAGGDLADSRMFHPRCFAHWINFHWIEIGIFTELKLNFHWIEIEFSLNWNWIFIELKLNFHWIEIEFSLNWNWIFIELKLNLGIEYCYNWLAIMQPVS